jgi:hypothetical protein
LVRLTDGTSGNLYALKQSRMLREKYRKYSVQPKKRQQPFIEGDFLLVDESDELISFISNDQNGLINGTVKAG